IEPAEIEHVLRAHASVGDAVVVTREDQPGEKRLVAYVVARDHPGDAALKTFLQRKLPEYMIPRSIVFLESIPLTKNGKLDRRALPAPDAAHSDSAGRIAPRNQIEETLANIWSGVLGIPELGIHDNFFELGGDSILSIQIIARANQAGLRLTPKQVFQHQTIATLAAVAGSEAIAEAEQGTVTGAVPLTPIQRWFFEQELEEGQHYN